MRIWSLHPEYIDSRGLVALWRETLLAKKVLQGKTKGYREHPQLERFKKMANPVKCIDQYLADVYIEAGKRGFNFNKNKIGWDFVPVRIQLSSGQMNFETEHLKKKLKTRDQKKYTELLKIKKVIPHPMFHVVEGEIEKWERI